MIYVYNLECVDLRLIVSIIRDSQSGIGIGIFTIGVSRGQKNGNIDWNRMGT